MEFNDIEFSKIMHNIDLSDIELCRLCLMTSKDSTSVFAVLEVCFQHKESERVSVAAMLVECSSWDQISDDDHFPKQICKKCLQKLQSAFAFRRMIDESQSILEKIAERSQTRQGCDAKEANVDLDTTVALDASCETVIASDIQCINIESTTDGGPDMHCDTDSAELAACPPVQGPPSDSAAPRRPRAPNKCPVCSKIFPGQLRLSTHLLVKHTVRNDQNVLRPHHCDKCDKCYTTHANLTIHKATHSGVKSFKCSSCARAFSKESSLTSHMSLHTGIRLHRCGRCDRSFTTASILQQHQRTHSEHRAHSCTVCHKGFYTSNDLRVHFRRHSGEKPFLCSACGHNFARKTHLNIHLRTHSGERPYKCDTCDRAFAQSGDLTAHVRIHTGEKPYTCKICQKSFNQTSGLRSHMKSHTGERNHVCQLCNKGFTQSSSLGRHLRLHSKILTNNT